jgi:hypothetical protein
MNRLSLFVLSLLLFPTACFGQSNSSDSQTLQALLLEVRQLRQDLQTTTIAGQRAQILIYRLQGQEAAVARVSQRLDEAREKLARIQSAEASGQRDKADGRFHKQRRQSSNSTEGA